MNKRTVFTKTAKGVVDAKKRASRLPGDLGLLFRAVNGKRPVSDLPEKTGMDEASVVRALARLVAYGYIKVFHEPLSAGDLDLDFTAGTATLHAKSAD